MPLQICTCLSLELACLVVVFTACHAMTGPINAPACISRTEQDVHGGEREFRRPAPHLAREPVPVDGQRGGHGIPDDGARLVGCHHQFHRRRAIHRPSIQRSSVDLQPSLRMPSLVRYARLSHRLAPVQFLRGFETMQISCSECRACSRGTLSRACTKRGAAISSPNCSAP